MKTLRFKNVFKLVTELAIRGVSVDYSVVDQNEIGVKCYGDLKTYTIEVKEWTSHGEPIKSASFDSLVKGMLWGFVTAFDYLEQITENEQFITLNDLDESPLRKIAELARKGVTIDYEILYRKRDVLAYSISVLKTWSFGEVITKELFDDLDEGMKWGIKIAEDYLKGDVCGQ